MPSFSRNVKAYMPERARIPELDGIRGLAITLVLINHYFRCQLGYPPYPQLVSFLSRVLSLSYSGVDLFFVLSGFLIGRILLKNLARRNYYSVFYIRRAAR